MSFALGRPVEGHPQTDTAAILQAAQLLANAASTATRHSSVIIVGPFEPQIYDLSSSSESGSSSEGQRLTLSRATRGSRSKTMVSPITPTKRSRKVQPQMLYHSPADQPDWVAYEQPDHDLEDIVDHSDSGSEADHNHERQPDSEDGCKHLEVSNEHEEWTMLRLQALQQVRSKSAAPRLYTRPFLKERIIPVQLPPVRPRPSPILLPAERPEMVISPLPIPSFTPMTPPSSSSLVTLVPSDSDCDPTCSAIKVGEQKALLHEEVNTCSACESAASRMVHLLPCGDLACPPCFSSSVAAVSVSRGVSKCPACLADVTSFKPYEKKDHITVKPTRRQKAAAKDAPPGSKTVVMRIDNVAWDIEPHLVEAFLPPSSLPADHPHPIHICLDRIDGRTKDYMYVEVSSPYAARRVLQKCQNAYMPGGRVTRGRKRAVTVSIVTHEELLRELRPSSKAELVSLVDLCKATLYAPPPQLRLDATGRGRLHASVGRNGKVHYIKYRHAPFHALMSILSKLRGRDSPAYMGIFHATTGAIIALSESLKEGCDESTRVSDAALLTKLISMFDHCFGVEARPLQL